MTQHFVAENYEHIPLRYVKNLYKPTNHGKIFYKFFRKTVDNSDFGVIIILISK